ncbi:MAG: hypothetical protein ACLFST_12155, partial [Spirochaetia bacterium]
MKPRTIDVDGISTSIREMGSDYIVGDDPEEAGIIYGIKCWPGRHVPGEIDRPQSQRSNQQSYCPL